MERTKIKVLVLGIGQSNFLNQLYGEILKINTNFSFHIDNSTHLPNDNYNETNNVFKENLDFAQYYNKIPKWKKLFVFLQSCKKKFYKEAFLFELNQKRTIRKAIKRCQEYALKEYIYKNYIKTKKFDLIHFHFCTFYNLEYLHFVEKEAKVICSFWGSDLYRMGNVYNDYYVGKALNKATLITVQSPEMALVIKAKYGMHLSDKIRDVRFTISTEIYNEINLNRSNKKLLAEFREKYKIKNYLVALGHNAFKENNHLKMIKVLHKLPEEYKNNISFLMHLGYGGEPKYLKELKNAILENNSLDIIIIDDFLSPQEISKLRLITNVMIQAPESDALSGAMVEVLYAGNNVIAGAWLPYGILRRNNIHFEEIDKFEELPLKLIKTLENLQHNLNTGIVNMQNIETFLFPERTSDDWINLFNSICE
jgi:glycosyltransferase involved in cell wall biosynthesis